MTAADGDDDETLDDGERFERMERARIQSHEPESLAYYSASKSAKVDCVFDVVFGVLWSAVCYVHRAKQ